MTKVTTICSDINNNNNNGETNVYYNCYYNEGISATSS